MMLEKYFKHNPLSELKHIKIQENLTEFPKELYSYKDTLEILDLSNNHLDKLPEDFDTFSELKILFLSFNQFTEFPSVLGKCPKLEMIGFKSNFIEHIEENAFPKTLRWLILTDNKIKFLPHSIGECSLLEKCALAGNLLQSLPESMQACKNLGLLRISANQIETLPDWLVQLPKLAWLAFSGNPCADSIHEQDEIELVNWDEIELTSQIGEGASGIISKGVWKTKNKAIAVKMFKGEVTSDGYPSDELATCLATGKHPNLVPLLAQIKNHPEGKDGIVMDLIPDSFSNLGLPPSFKTCTRDVFDPSFQLEEDTAFNIIKHTANAAKHLHSKGILHGDLYAHNTLYNAKGETYLGDFGAASFYSKSNPLATYIERLDVLAFGYLMDDLITHTNFKNDNLKHKLSELRNLCLLEKVGARPCFEQLVKELSDRN